MAVPTKHQDLIDRIRLLKEKHWFSYGFVGPFLVVLYPLWVLFTMFYTDLEIEGCLIILAGIGVLQILVVLSCLWSVHFLASMTHAEVKNIKEANMALVVPTANNGSPEIVRVQLNRGGDQFYIIFQNLRFEWDPEKRTFRGLDFPTDRRVDHYINWKGYEDEAQLAKAADIYGDNTVTIRIPKFQELFKERASSPFFVFQVFCVGLWCLDEYWHYSVFTLVMLILFECTLVKQQIGNLSEIRNMGSKPCQIQVYRNRKWRSLKSDQLVVGDMVSVTRSQSDAGNQIPCDLILVRGQCIVDESMLTGESVPQLKEPLDQRASSSLEENNILNEDVDGKLHFLYGGTKVVAVHSPPSKFAPGLKPPDNGCVAYVVRTGFNTQQGGLLSTILFSVRSVTANNLECLAFILFLLAFAIAAASYVWIKGTEDPDRNRYKLFLECTLILTSVVPPELPIELSLAVNSSLVQLVRLAIFCTEPFRIPFAGKVEYCCFDKTGTLTSDDLIVEGVVGAPPTDTNDGDNSVKSTTAELTPLHEAPKSATRVLATCHSLTMMEDGLIGDPLEKAVLAALGWNLTKGDAVVPKKGSHPALKIVSRFHFSSAMKRMSVVAGFAETGFGNGDVKYIVTTKGAPETLKPMFRSIPVDYDSTYLGMSRKGARVLALGIKELGSITFQAAQDLKRDEAERDLDFAGFIVTSCPLKKDSKSVVRELLGSSHQVVMITGDNSLTACHVSTELRITRKDKPILVLTNVSEENHLSSRVENVESSSNWEWLSVDGKTSKKLPADDSDTRRLASYIKGLLKENELCVTGDGLQLLQSQRPELHRKLVPCVKVFARCAPKQKESIVTLLRDSGFSVLMCGDGTNDVGALKHAHVGVAILSGGAKPSGKFNRNSDAAAATISADVPASSNSRNAAAIENSNSDDSVVNPRLKKSKGGNAKLLGRTGPSVAARGLGPQGGGATTTTVAAGLSRQQAALQKMLDELQEAEQPQIVKMGDASIAAPFTSKNSSITCVNHVIKQGRCTLVTTLQMFKILALNALVLAYSQSVLYLEGVKFSDGQATLQGILLAAVFLFISRAKPLTVLSKQRPLPNIFNAYTILTVLTQFAVHFWSLVYLVQAAFEREPREGKPDLEKEFEPNLLNSTVYIISMALQVATFAINYRGLPFMEPIWENKSLLISLVSTYSFVIILVLGVSPDLCDQFGIVLFPDEFRRVILRILAADFFLSLICDRICLFLFGEGKLRQPV